MQAQLFEALPQQGGGGFGAVALAPGVAGEGVAELAAAVLRIDHPELDRADHPAGSGDLDRRADVPARPDCLGFEHPVQEGPALLQGIGSPDHEARHLRIGAVGVDGLQVAVAEFAQDQARRAQRKPRLEPLVFEGPRHGSSPVGAGGEGFMPASKDPGRSGGVWARSAALASRHRATPRGASISGRAERVNGHGAASSPGAAPLQAGTCSGAMG